MFFFIDILVCAQHRTARPSGQKKIPVIAALSKEDRNSVQRRLQYDFDEILTAFTNIKADKTTATFPGFRARVREWILEAHGLGGFEKIDDAACDAMHSWLAATATKIAEERDAADYTNAGLTTGSAQLPGHLARFDEAETMLR